MTGSGRTLDPREREDLIGRAVRRLLGPVPKVEYIPPEGSIETEPPYHSEEIRYWAVINGKRQCRHRSSWAALRQTEARHRLKAALLEMLRRAPHRLATIAGGFAVLWAAAAFTSVMMYEGGADYSSSTALSLYFAVWFSCFVLLVGFGAWRVKRLFTESCGIVDLSADEDNLLSLPVATVSALAPFALFYVVATASQAILFAFGVGAG